MTHSAESVAAEGIRAMWPTHRDGEVQLGPRWAIDLARWALVALEEAGWTLHNDGSGRTD